MPTKTLDARSQLRRPDAPIAFLAAAFVAAAGVVHLREWLDLYRHVPSSISGAAVVRVGFPLDATASAIVAALLVAGVLAGRKLLAVGLVLAALFQAGAIAILVLSRHGGVFGWMETGWNRGASQALAVEIGALVVLALVTLVVAADQRAPRSQSNAATDALAVDRPRRVPPSFAGSRP